MTPVLCTMYRVRANMEEAYVNVSDDQNGNPPVL